MSNHFFSTTPEAVLRAEAILTAFRDGREGDIAQTLMLDTEGGSTSNPWELMVALIGITDRLADYTARLYAETQGTPVEDGGIIREASRVVAQAVYTRRAQHGGDHEGEDTGADDAG